MNILFVYPNKDSYPMIPLGISVLAGILRDNDYNVDVFDITFMMEEKIDNTVKEKTGMVKKTNVNEYWGDNKDINVIDEYEKKINSFKPDLVCFSIVENNYTYAKKLIDKSKEFSGAPLIVGGIFPTTAPEFFIDDDNVDLICIGEGEDLILEVAKRVKEKRGYENIPNLLTNENKRINYYPYYNWEPYSYQCCEIFDDRHFYKPFLGKVWRAGYFETSRGCPHKCTYCANCIYQDKFKELGKYNRTKPIEYVIKEIEYMVDKYDLDLVWFNDENFMMMSKDRFNEFAEKYKERINLPFFMQTRANTLLDEEKIKTLKEIGCASIGVGLEVGNEERRRKFLQKNVSNESYKKALDLCNKYDLRVSCNVIIGLPFETEEDIMETMNFCKEIKTPSVTVSVFAPYHGSKLYDTCIENELIEKKYYDDISIRNESVLNMPQLSKEKINELYYNFNKMVFGDN